MNRLKLYIIYICIRTKKGHILTYILTYISTLTRNNKLNKHDLSWQNSRTVLHTDYSFLISGGGGV